MSFCDTAAPGGTCMPTICSRRTAWIRDEAGTARTLDPSGAAEPKRWSKASILIQKTCFRLRPEDSVVMESVAMRPGGTAAGLTAGERILEANTLEFEPIRESEPIKKFGQI